MKIRKMLMMGLVMLAVIGFVVPIASAAELSIYSECKTCEPGCCYYIFGAKICTCTAGYKCDTKSMSGRLYCCRGPRYAWTAIGASGRSDCYGGRTNCDLINDGPIYGCSRK